MKRLGVLAGVTLGLLFCWRASTAEGLADAAKQEATRRARLAEERAKGMGAYANHPASGGTYSVVPVNPGYLAPSPTPAPPGYNTPGYSAPRPGPSRLSDLPPPPTPAPPPDPRLKKQVICQEGLPPSMAGNELGHPGVKPQRVCTEVR
jgi:hypothetical protein